MYKLFYSPGACSFAPHLVLEEIGAPYELELVSTSDDSTQADEYLKVNVKGRVPVLVSGDEVITEASAIMIFLAMYHPESKLIGDTPLVISRTIEWMNWLSTIHASIISQSWRTERFTDDTNAFTGIQEKGMKNLVDAYRQIDQKLADKKWAMGEGYSIVDPYLLVFYRWGNRLGLDMKEFKSWTVITKKIEKRMAIQSVLNKEDISIWG